MTLAFVFALIVPATLVDESAQACSYAGPVSFQGFAVLFDVETFETTQISFSEVGIDGMCGTANLVGVDGPVAFVTEGRGVHLFGMDGDLGFLDLGVDNPVGPNLDGAFVYYGSYEENALYRMNVTTRTRELVVDSAPFGALGFNILVVRGGIVAWTTHGTPTHLTVYDVPSRTFLLRDGAMPTWPGEYSPANIYLLEVAGNRLRFLLEGQDVGEYDVIANTTAVVGRLPVAVAFPWEDLAASDGRYVYRQPDGLVVYDSNLNVTRVLPPEHRRASNLAMAGDRVAYNYHEVHTGAPLWLLPFALLAVAGLVTAAVAYAYRRRKS